MFGNGLSKHLRLDVRLNPARGEHVGCLNLSVRATIRYSLDLHGQSLPVGWITRSTHTYCGRSADGQVRSYGATSETNPLSQLDRMLDRSHLMPPGAVESVLQGMKAGNDP